MKLIAKKPCSFGGRNFYIDQEIPKEFVAEPAVQERLGVITVVEDKGSPVSQYDGEAILAARIADVSAFAGKVIVPVISKEDGDTAETMSVPLTEGQVQQVFSIMQMNVPDAEKVINEVTEEDVLIVLHACDSRSKVKKAAKNRADTLIPTDLETNDPTGSNEATDYSQEADNQPSE